MPVSTGFAQPLPAVRSSALQMQLVREPAADAQGFVHSLSTYLRQKTGDTAYPHSASTRRTDSDLAFSDVLNPDRGGHNHTLIMTVSATTKRTSKAYLTRALRTTCLIHTRRYPREGWRGRSARTACTVIARGD